MEIEQTKQATFSDQIEADLVLHSFAFIGAIHGVGKIDVEAKEIVSLNSMSPTHLIILTATQNYDEVTGRSILRLEKAEQLMSILERLSKTDLSFVKFPQSEIRCSFEDDFIVVVFNDKKGKLQFSISCAGVSAFFPDLRKLVDLRDHIAAAIKYIDQHKYPIEAT